MSRRHAAAVLALGLVALVLAWISCTGPTALETRRGDAGGARAPPDAHVAEAPPQRSRVAAQPPPAPATTAQQQRTTLRVVARLPGGAPLAGVTVVARFESPRFDAIGDEVARAVTDAAGEAVIDACCPIAS